MALDWSQTADDDTLIQTLRPLMADKIWHDGTRWWARDTSQPRGTWIRTSVIRLVWRHLASAGDQLPDTPYWARSKHRLRMISHMYAIAAQLAWDCQYNQWPKPDDLAS